MQKRFLVLLQIFCGTLITASIASLATCWLHPDLASNLRCLFVLLPIVLCRLITKRSGSILLFLLSGCIMTAAVFLLSAKGPEQYLFSAVTIIIWGSFLFSQYSHRECWLMQPHGGGLALFFCMYLFGSTQNFPYLCYLAHYFTVFYLLGLLLYTNQYRFLDFIQKNFRSANLPYSRIHSINRLLITIMTAVAALVLFALPVSGMDGLFGLVKKLLVLLLRPLFALLEGSEPPPEEEELPPDVPEMPTGGLPQMEGEASPIWTILSNILVTLCLAALAIGIVKLLIHFIKNYHKHISKDGDQVEFIDKSPETTAAKKESSFSRLPSRNSDPNVQIRKLYKKRILSQRRPGSPVSSPSVQGSHPLLQGAETRPAPPSLLKRLENRLRPQKSDLPNAAHTPAQIETDSHIADELLHNVYEQARYSKKGCTRADLALLKNRQ